MSRTDARYETALRDGSLGVMRSIGDGGTKLTRGWPTAVVHVSVDCTLERVATSRRMKSVVLQSQLVRLWHVVPQLAWSHASAALSVALPGTTMGAVGGCVSKPS